MSTLCCSKPLPTANNNLTFHSLSGPRVSRSRATVPHRQRRIGLQVDAKRVSFEAQKSISLQYDEPPAWRLSQLHPVPSGNSLGCQPRIQSDRILPQAMDQYLSDVSRVIGVMFPTNQGDNSKGPELLEDGTWRLRLQPVSFFQFSATPVCHVRYGNAHV